MAPTPPVDDDFDAWFSEQGPKPYRFKLLGKRWELPPEVPALTVLRYERLLQLIGTLPDDDDVEVDLPDGFTVNDLSYETVVRDLAGNEMVEEWLKLGLTDSMYAGVAQRLVGRYILKDTTKLGGDDQGKAPRAPQDHKPPATKRTTAKPRSSSRGSSATGRSSKPAGKPSTTETSPTT